MLNVAIRSEKRSHQGGNAFKAGTRPAIILERLCEGDQLSGWSVCKLLKTHNGDRDLRWVRKRLKMLGIGAGRYLTTDWMACRIWPKIGCQ